ncbi:ATP-dependent DNA helicase PIF1-like protein [Tanacetum coccineum]
MPIIVYVIEFQKRGLPHAHILLWLEEHCKCKTPSEIDDIISAEMPSPTDDPDGYKVVTDYMLHGPCGKDARNAACTNDGKCSKHFPKPFLAETFLDEDRYPHNHQRDNKVTFEKGKIVYSSPASGERYYLRMLLNVVRGVKGFEALMTVNKRLCATFKETCFAYGLLNDDKEWSHTIAEASLWALGPQLRDIFVTMLLFCDVSIPLKLYICNYVPTSHSVLMAIGIASLLLPAGRTTYSRFVIPLELMENSTCGIKQNTQLAELMQEILWALRIQKKAPNLWGHDGVAGRSELWRYCKVFTLTRSMRVNEYSTNGGIDTTKQEFNQWVLAVGDGTLPARMKEGEDEPTRIDIPEKHTNDGYLKERAILTLQNDDADAINEFMFKQLSGESVTYNSADEVCMASTTNIDQHQLYPVEFLNSLNFPGMPPYELRLKKNYPSCFYRISIQAKDYAMEQD